MQLPEIKVLSFKQFLQGNETTFNRWVFIHCHILLKSLEFSKQVFEVYFRIFLNLSSPVGIELVISGRDEKAERAGQATSKTGMQEMCVGGVASLHAHRLHHINDTCSSISLSAYHQSLLCSSHLQNLLLAGDLKKFIHTQACMTTSFLHAALFRICY